jgi:hypothetical protein
MDIVLIRAVVLRLPEPLGVAARVKVTAFWSKFSAPHVHDFKAAGPPQPLRVHAAGLWRVRSGGPRVSERDDLIEQAYHEPLPPKPPEPSK